MIFEQVFINTIIHFKAYQETCATNIDIYKVPTMADTGLSLLFVSHQLHTETAMLPYKLCRFQLPRVLGGEVCGEKLLVKFFFKEQSKDQIKAMSDLSVEASDWQNSAFTCFRGTGSYRVEMLITDRTEK
jgi:hypothetical protein